MTTQDNPKDNLCDDGTKLGTRKRPTYEYFDGYTNRPKENVLLGNGMACYRMVAMENDPILPEEEMYIKVIEFRAHMSLKKCYLTLDEYQNGTRKDTVNRKKIFKEGDTINVLYSDVFEKYVIENPYGFGCIPQPLPQNNTATNYYQCAALSSSQATPYPPSTGAMPGVSMPLTIEKAAAASREKTLPDFLFSMGEVEGAGSSSASKNVPSSEKKIEKVVTEEDRERFILGDKKNEGTKNIVVKIEKEDEAIEEQEEVEEEEENEAIAVKKGDDGDDDEMITERKEGKKSEAEEGEEEKKAKEEEKEDRDREEKPKTKKRQSREDKDLSNVWIIVVAKSDGSVNMWQRNVDLMGNTLKNGIVKYIPVNVIGSGYSHTMPRVLHKKGGPKRDCYQISIAPGSTLWIEKSLFYKRNKDSGLLYAEGSGKNVPLCEEHGDPLKSVLFTPPKPIPLPQSHQEKMFQASEQPLHQVQLSLILQQQQEQLSLLLHQQQQQLSLFIQHQQHLPTKEQRQAQLSLLSQQHQVLQAHLDLLSQQLSQCQMYLSAEGGEGEAKMDLNGFYGDDLLKYEDNGNDYSYGMYGDFDN